MRRKTFAWQTLPAHKTGGELRWNLKYDFQQPFVVLVVVVHSTRSIKERFFFVRATVGVCWCAWCVRWRAVSVQKKRLYFIIVYWIWDYSKLDLGTQLWELRGLICREMTFYYNIPRKTTERDAIVSCTAAPSVTRAGYSHTPLFCFASHGYW